MRPLSSAPQGPTASNTSFYTVMSAAGTQGGSSRISASSGHPPSYSRPHPMQHASSPAVLLAAAGTAGLAATAYEHHYHKPLNLSRPSQDSFQPAISQLETYSSVAGPAPGSSISQVHSGHVHHQPPRKRGALGRFVEWWQDLEDVRKMEEYTEYIGVCRHCFDPRSAPGDAPRRHHYHRRGSRDRQHRVDKDSRYSSSSSSESETTRRRRSAQHRHSPRLDRRSSDRRSSTSYGIIELDSRSDRTRGDERSNTRERSVRTTLSESAEKPLSTSYRGQSQAQSTKRPRHEIYEEEEIRVRFEESSESEQEIGFFSSLFSPSSRAKRTDRSTGRQDLETDVRIVRDKHIGSNKRQRVIDTHKPRTSNATEALLGIGAVTAALVAADSHGSSHRAPRAGFMLQTNPYRPTPSHPQRDQGDESWESASESDASSSANSALAFGEYESEKLVKRRTSRESLSSDVSGTDRWGWRWRKNEHRRRSPVQDSRKHQSEEAQVIAAELQETFEAKEARGASRKGRSTKHLQHLDPQPISLSPDPASHNTVNDIPLYQPQPISPPRLAIFEAQSAAMGSSDRSFQRPGVHHTQSAPTKLRYLPWAEKSHLTYGKDSDISEDKTRILQESFGLSANRGHETQVAHSDYLLGVAAAVGGAALVGGGLVGVADHDVTEVTKRKNQRSSVRFAGIGDDEDEDTTAQHHSRRGSGSSDVSVIEPHIRNTDKQREG